MNGIGKKVVVVADLARYSDVAKLLEEQLGVNAVAQLNDQIRLFVDQALADSGVDAADAVVKRTGDGVILSLDDAATASRFAEALHRNAAESNRGKDVTLPQRHFRVGISSGNVVIGDDFAGAAVVFAARLEARCRTGEVLIEENTWSDLPHAMKGLYGTEVEEVAGKHDERFFARRRQVVDPAPWDPSFQTMASPPRYTIERIQLENIRCFRRLQISLATDDTPVKWIMIVGDNAKGKTTLLRCLALGLCNETDAIALMQETRGEYLRAGETEGVVKISLKRADDGTVYTIRTTITRSSADAPEIVRQRITPEEGFSWDDLFVCGYGTYRSTEANESYEKYSSRNALQTLFDGEASLHNPELVLVRHPHVRERLERRLAEVLMLDDPEYGVSFSERGLVVRGPWGDAPFRSLSDGYRSTTQWMVDFIGWQIYANRFGNSDAGGILLIDELEQHLHPRWQRHIVERLRQQFPETQIFSTTHTPLVAAGVVDLEDAMLLRLVEEDEGAVTAHVLDKKKLMGKRADQVLASEAFGLVTTRSPKSTDDLSRYAELLGKVGNGADEEREILREQLKASLLFGENEFEQTVELAVSQALDKLVEGPPDEVMRLEAKRQLRELFRTGEKG